MDLKHNFCGISVTLISAPRKFQFVVNFFVFATTVKLFIAEVRVAEI